jgi:hypothetical protein
MTGRRYTNLLFYGSTDPEEFQDFSKTKKTSRVVLEFEDYALDWWKQYYIKNWEDLKKAMRKEFISRKYGLILLRRSENVKQVLNLSKHIMIGYILPCIRQMLLMT